MEKEQITITVAGKAGSGKSTITYLLKEFLNRHDFDVKFQNIDFVNEQKFDSHMKPYIADKMNAVKESKIIVLKEVQLARTYKSDNGNPF